ncbi:MAG: hypothetical protein V4510_03250 [bacterium]
MRWLAAVGLAALVSGCTVQQAPPPSASVPTVSPDEAPVVRDCGSLSLGNLAAFVQVRSPNGTIAPNLGVTALRDWHAYADSRSNAKGCVAFGFVDAGEYEFMTSGSCALQGTISAMWNGTEDLVLTLATQDVCES